MKDKWRRWKVRKRPRLRPGEPLVFYDPTGLIPLARMRVDNIKQTLNQGTMIELRDEGSYLSRATIPVREVHYD